jgi:hypothetical protein
LNVKQRSFLSAFVQLGSLRLASEAAKVSRRSHYNWLKQCEYAVAFANAREEAADQLEAEARRRAVDGIEVPG